MKDKENIGHIQDATMYDTLIGTIRIWAGPQGIKRLSFEGTSSESRREESTPDSAVIRKATKQLAQYFTGELKRFDLPLDLSSCSDFQLRVFQELHEIPYGQFQTYRNLAEALDQPRASRSVGQALKANPIPIFLPCHRVIRSDGRLGGYVGNLEHNLQRKTTLLEMEGIKIKNGTIRDMNPDETLSLPF